MLKAARTLAIAILSTFVAIPAAQGEFRIGRAKTVITPPAGMPMAGSYRLRLSEGVLDDLYAKALVIEQEGVKSALVACDLVAVSDEIVESARALISAKTGVPGENVMISATHTHSGPFIPGRASFDKDFSGGLAVVEQFRKQLPEQIAAAVLLAEADLQPALVFAGAGKESSVSFNRRYVMKDGSVRTNPGVGNPDIVRPAGPIDPTIPVILFTTADDKRTPLVTYVNHALHAAVSGGVKFSADFPGVISRLLSEVKGEQMLTIFTAGACGNVNHINVNSKEARSGPPGATRIGVILAAEILRTYERLEQIPPGKLQIQRRKLKLPLIEFSDAEIAEARRLTALAGGPDDPGTQVLADAFRKIDVASRQGRPFEKEVQVISLGDALAWVSLPGEIFVEHAMAITEFSPFRHTVVAELANGWISYVPDKKAIPEGSYEVVSSRCGVGCGEVMADAAVEMLVQSHANTLPAHALDLTRR